MEELTIVPLIFLNFSTSNSNTLQNWFDATGSDLGWYYPDISARPAQALPLLTCASVTGRNRPSLSDNTEIAKRHRPLYILLCSC